METSFDPTIKRVQSTTSSEAAIKRGKKFLKEKRFDEALTEFESVVAQNNATPFVHSAMGRIKNRQKDHEGALEHFKAWIKLAPTNARSYVHAARAYAGMGMFDEAQQDLENAIKVNPKLTVAYAGLGQVYLRKKKYPESVEQFHHALRLNPRLLPARKRVARALSELGKNSEAMEHIKAAMRIKSDDPEVLALKGKLHLKEKDYAAAQRAYSDAIELSGENASTKVRMGLAEALIEGGQLAQAEKVFSGMSQREQFSPLVHKLLGDLYYRQGLHKEAVEEYRAASLMVQDQSIDEDIDTFDFAVEDDNDVDWSALAQSYGPATAEFVEKKRQGQ